MDIFLSVGKAVSLAVLAGVGFIAIWIALCHLLQIIFRSKIEKIAVSQFRKDYPYESFGFSHKIKYERKNVVMIAYGDTMPPQRKYYLVDVESQQAIIIENDLKYRPKIDR